MTQARGRQIPLSSIVIGLVLCLVGLGVAIYLTIEHFDSAVTLACPDTGRINCQRVTTSQYSHLGGIPVAVLGVVYFAVALVLLSPQAWRSTSASVRWGRIGWVAVGAVMVLYLVWAEFFGVNAICLWCTAVHVITFLLFVLVAFTEAWVLPTRDAAPA
jgi:uncharacterized membrane protein